MYVYMYITYALRTARLSRVTRKDDRLKIYIIHVTGINTTHNAYHKMFVRPSRKTGNLMVDTNDAILPTKRRRSKVAAFFMRLNLHIYSYTYIHTHINIHIYSYTYKHTHIFIHM